MSLMLQLVSSSGRTSARKVWLLQAELPGQTSQKVNVGSSHKKLNFHAGSQDRLRIFKNTSFSSFLIILNAGEL